MSTTKSAVSDYEHLKYRSAPGNPIGINESDDDELFLKAPIPLSSIPNDNNSNVRLHSLKSNNHFQSVKQSIPVPLAWSPGFMLESNPALLITPEKPIKPTKSPGNEDHLLASYDRAPQPVPWSPGMRLEKSVFITPDKASNYDQGNINKTDSLKNSEYFNTKLSQGTDKSSKERQTVRFDLPSFSGEDTFFDENSSLFSPVTIRGKDINPLATGEEFTSTSPMNFSSKSYESKSYNPNLYSDDSTMDESILTSQKNAARDIDSHANITLSTSANLVDKLRELMQNTDFSGTATNYIEIPSNDFVTADNSANMKQSTALETKSTRVSKKNGKGTNNLKTQLNNKDNHSSEILVIKESHGKSKAYSSQNKSNKYNKKTGAQFLKDPVSAYHPPSSGSCIVKEPQNQIDSREYSYPFQDGVKENDNDSEIEHAFARPEFNSTLRFRQELDNICDQEIDLVKAVNKKLKQTGDKRAEIHEKAANHTNCPSDQFSNLIDLDLPVDRLCDRVIKMRTSKVVKKRKMPPEKVAKTPANIPDLMEFYSPDLQKETPGFSLHGINSATSDLLGASSDLAFDVYRHNRVWNGVHDF